jgi:hypothetical protein
MPASRTAEVLLKLLDKVPDSKTLEVLIEPENLLKLLELYGYQRNDLTQRLSSGTIPGDLLLELLEKEPDTDKLLAQLGILVEKSDDVQPKKDAAKASDAEPDSAWPTPVPYSPQAPDTPAVNSSNEASNSGGKKVSFYEKYYWLIPIVIISTTVITPALIISGFLANVKLSQEIATIMALIGGIVAGALVEPKKLSWKGALVGAAYGVSTLWATILYTQARTFILKIELALPLLIGAIPAVVVFALLTWLFPKKKDSQA